MKPLVLALTVVLFATLLNLVTAGAVTDSKVLASYKDYDTRQFAKHNTVACVTASTWNDLDKAEKELQSNAGGTNDKKQKVPLGKGGIMIKKRWSKGISYCKFVSAGYKGPKGVIKNKEQVMRVLQAPLYTFFGKMVADKTPKTIQDTAAQVAAMVTGEKNFLKKIVQGAVVVEITEDNKIYVGPMTIKFFIRKKVAPKAAIKAGPKGGPKKAGPKKAGPKKAGPKKACPKKGGPKKGGPKKGGPKKGGPKKAGPKKAGPKKAGPKKAGPKKAGPKKAGPKKAGTKKAGPKKAAPAAAPAVAPAVAPAAVPAAAPAAAPKTG